MSAPPTAAQAPPVLVATDGRGVATVTLNRAHVNNAYDGALLAALTEGARALGADPRVRVIVIRGAGRHFQAGADLGWLRAMAEAAPEAAFAASMGTTAAMAALNECSKPTLALVNGACFGGGCGLVACCDIAIAASDAIFGLTEVRVGVAPSPISTHLVAAMGLRHARRYGISGERFDAAEAARIGLVHEVVEPDALESRGEAIVAEILKSAPGAIARTKASLLAANGLVLDGARLQHLAHDSWLQRGSDEGREGLAAFAQKRKPAWAP
ncbi:MAG: enoyl-CoA hydratase/isomerase family protein [Acetobacteraceae bacterium]|nr:enoyl-CoA hydratase/isomerase family protein [Acetobacteraceae bacterium]